MPDSPIPVGPGAERPGPIDLAHLRRQTLDDHDLQRELLDLFARQARTILGDLAAAAGSSGAARQRRADLLHTLCGSARAIGAWEVAAGAEEMERVERGPALTKELAAEGEGLALDRCVTRACKAADDLRAADGDRCESPRRAEMPV